ncbi:MAG: flippase-like domain-containing protein [Clostridia bacterium]|nr:flippase-like domain-containing protein [Clostridia bacterium]
MNPRTKKILNFVLIFGTLAIVLIIGASGQELGSALDALRTIAPQWIVLCALSFVVYTVLDALIIWYFLHRQGYVITFGYALFVAIAGLYYSNVTPGATGGQPMQVYHLKQISIPIAIGTSALAVKYFCFHTMLMVLSTVLWIAHGPFIRAQVGSSMWILVFGYAYNAVAVLAVLLVATNKRWVRAIISWGLKLAVKLRLCKDPEGVRAKLEEGLETFHGSIMMLAQHPLDFIVQMILGGVQLLSHIIVIYFLYHAFGLTGSNYSQLTALGLLLYVSAAYTPLPGASGAQEGVFALYFSQIFPDGVRFMALLLWRFFTYYISLIVGAIVTVWQGFSANRSKKA